MKPIERIDEPQSYEKDSKYARSTVLDYPDMEKVAMTSVHQQGTQFQSLIPRFCW